MIRKLLVDRNHSSLIAHRSCYRCLRFSKADDEGGWMLDVGCRVSFCFAKEVASALSVDRNDGLVAERQRMPDDWII